MADFTVTLSRLTAYVRHEGCSFILCGIDFHSKQSGDCRFRAECDKRTLEKLLGALDAYLAGEITSETSLVFVDPQIAGGCEKYSYSFRILPKEKLWIFRIRRSNAEYSCKLYANNVLSLRNQLRQQYDSMDWDSVGKAEIYNFTFPEKACRWAYSAKELEETLQKLCVGETIEAVYVGATNYGNPLSLHENYVNYYVGNQILLQMKNILLDLRVCAEGLVQWRAFSAAEYKVRKEVRLQKDGADLCKLGDAYGAFDIDYTQQPIGKVTVTATDCWPWDPRDFEGSKVGEPVELPDAIRFHLSDGHVFSLWGQDDDFVIWLKKEDEIEQKRIF